ncbi:hypothetical protein HAX54_007811 [Datura stramonium]|uniref:H(+)-exporting diphosphatase n=1 Tax=Datura stramonium TaxID=4076 RepID=A0ABS8RI65_DATST|nr:hypothetical protein [Datura stramonium]
MEMFSSLVTSKANGKFTGITLQVVQREGVAWRSCRLQHRKDFQSDVIDISVVPFMLILMEDSAVHVKDRFIWCGAFFMGPQKVKSFKKLSYVLIAVEKFEIGLIVSLNTDSDTCSCSYWHWFCSASVVWSQRSESPVGQNWKIATGLIEEDEQEEGIDSDAVVAKCAEIQKAISEGGLLFSLNPTLCHFGLHTKRQDCPVAFILTMSNVGRGNILPVHGIQISRYIHDGIWSNHFSLSWIGKKFQHRKGPNFSPLWFPWNENCNICQCKNNSGSKEKHWKAFVTAFRSEFAVMGFLLAANGLLVLYVSINLFKLYYGDDWEGLYESITGYGLGGSSMALFGRVGGGIYTKAADVGADLVGKLNVIFLKMILAQPSWDIAGMGLDLFGSYAESSCAALFVASISSFGSSHDYSAMSYPLIIQLNGNCCFT